MYRSLLTTHHKNFVKVVNVITNHKTFEYGGTVVCNAISYLFFECLVYYAAVLTTYIHIYIYGVILFN